MIAALKGRSLIFKIVFVVALVPMFIPMFIYEIVMATLGKRTYSKPQIAREFDHGYSPLHYGRGRRAPSIRKSGTTLWKKPMRNSPAIYAWRR